MKSFSQFLQESYMNEGVAPGERRSARRRKPSKSVEELKAEIDARDAAKASAKAAKGPTGAAANPEKYGFKSTKVQSPATPKKPSSSTTTWRPGGENVKRTFPKPASTPSTPSSSTTTWRPGGENVNPTFKPQQGSKPAPSSSGGKPTSGARPSTTYRNVGVGKETFATKPSQSQPQTSSGSQKQKWNPQSERARKSGETTDAWRERIRQQKTSGKPSSSAILPAGKPTSSAMAPAGKPPSEPKIKVPSGLAKVGRVAGKLVGPASAALDVADEKAKGSGWARSLAKGAAVAAGGALGGAAGSVAGPVGSVAGATGGAMAASKAFDVAAGANAKERKAMATANRQRQAGTAIKGIGGKTTFDTKKNTMTTGSGAQRKTVQLAKTGVVQRGGQSTAGHLAYKGGQAVYKAGPSAQSLAKTSSNPLERVGRTLFAGAYKKSDAAAAAKKLSAARASDVARNKALGVKALPGK